MFVIVCLISKIILVMSIQYFSILIIISICIFRLMTSKDDQQQQQRGCQHNFLQGKIKQRYDIMKKIGSGAYGHVWKVRCKQTKTIFAIKKVFLAFQDETDAQRVYRQINLLQKISHDNVVKLKQIIPSDNHTDIYLLFEYLESDVFQAIKNRVLDTTHKKFIVYQLACGLKYLHSGGVVHRDLKPSNILINSNCDVKICDFGLSRSVTSQFFNKAIMTEFIATRWYRAPEVLMGSKSYSYKSDMWSLGCLIYQLYSRRTLLPGQNTIDQITKLLQFKGVPTQQEIQSFRAPKSTEILTFFKVQKQPLQYFYNDLENKQIKEVLNNLLEYNPNKRWSAEQLLQSNFLKQFKNVLTENSCKQQIHLALNDNRRYGVDRYKLEILNLFGQKNQKSKQKLVSKRIYLSHRASNNKSNFSLHGNLSKFTKTSLNSSTIRGDMQKKQFKSAHVSPNVQRSIDKLVANARKNILKVSQRLTSNQRKREISKDLNNSIQIGKKIKSKKYIKPQRIIKEQPQLNKENYQKRLKILKKQRLKHYRSDLQA